MIRSRFVRAALLRPLAVYADDGAELVVSVSRLRAVLSLLALRAGAVVRSGELVWGCGVRTLPVSWKDDPDVHLGVTANPAGESDRDGFWVADAPGPPGPPRPPPTARRRG